MQIVIGFKDHSWSAKPHLVYLGTNAEDAQKAIAATADAGFVRLGRLSHPHLLTVSVPPMTPEVAAERAAQETEQRRADDEAKAKLEAEKLELANLREEVKALHREQRQIAEICSKAEEGERAARAEAQSLRDQIEALKTSAPAPSVAAEEPSAPEKPSKKNR